MPMITMYFLKEVIKNVVSNFVFVGLKHYQLSYKNGYYTLSGSEDGRFTYLSPDML